MIFYPRYIFRHLTFLKKSNWIMYLISILSFGTILHYALFSTDKPVIGTSYGIYYDYGWPFVFMNCNVDVWKEGIHLNSIGRFIPGLLIANIFIAVSLALAITFFWYQLTVKQSWCRFLSKFFFLVAVAMSYTLLCTTPIFEYKREASIALRLREMNWTMGERMTKPSYWWLIRPLIDLGILADNPEFIDRVHFISWKGESTDSTMWTFDENDIPYSNNQVDDCIHETSGLVHQFKYCDAICICSCVVTNEGLNTLSANWNGCRLLDLGNSVGFNDQGFVQVLENWPYLEYVVLSNTDLTDQGILELKKLPNLSHVLLDGMENITIGTVEKLIKNGKKLKYLRLPDWWQEEEEFLGLLSLAEKRGIKIETATAFFEREKPAHTTD